MGNSLPKYTFQFGNYIHGLKDIPTKKNKNGIYIIRDLELDDVLLIIYESRKDKTTERNCRIIKGGGQTKKIYKIIIIGDNNYSYPRIDCLIGHDPFIKKTSKEWTRHKEHVDEFFLIGLFTNDYKLKIEKNKLRFKIIILSNHY